MNEELPSNELSSKELPPILEIKSHITRETTDRLYKNFYVSIVCILMLYVILFSQLYVDKVSGSILTPTILISWFSVSILILLSRIILLFWYKSTHTNNNLLKTQFYLFFLGSIFSAATFGSIASFLMPTEIQYQVLVLIVTAGLVAGSVQSLSSSFIVNASYTLIILFPMLVWQLIQILQNNRIYIGIFISMIVFTIFSVLIAWENYKNYFNNIKLKYENIMIAAQLRKEATHDMLTGLYNRYYLHDHLNLEIKRAKRKSSSLALLMMDIDEFKHFNDKYSHNVGDKVLLLVANLLKKSMRSSDVICRYGGDEFIIVLTEATGPQAYARAEALMDASQELIIELPNNNKEKISLSIGISTFPKHGETEEELIKTADVAMYMAKKKKNSVYITS